MRNKIYTDWNKIILTNAGLKMAPTTLNRWVSAERCNQKFCDKINNNDKLGLLIAVCSYSQKQRKYWLENEILSH